MFAALLVAGLVIGATQIVPLAKSLKSQATLYSGQSLSDGELYLLHATTATVLGIVHASPSTTAVQWVKAASHAHSAGEIARAGRGIADARARSNSSTLDRDLCNVYNYSNPSVQAAIHQVGLICEADSLSRAHVPAGTPIIYDQNPPIGGPHYPNPYPTYGLIEHPVQPGYWVHNLEHGAIVLLYNCPRGCADLVDQARTLYLSLPPGRNPYDGHARLLVIPYASMSHPIAVVAWDHKLELDRLDRDQIVGFYERYVDRGPECWNLTCPL